MDKHYRALLRGFQPEAVPPIEVTALFREGDIGPVTITDSVQSGHSNDTLQGSCANDYNASRPFEPPIRTTRKG